MLTWIVLSVFAAVVTLGVAGARLRARQLAQAERAGRIIRRSLTRPPAAGSAGPARAPAPPRVPPPPGLTPGDRQLLACLAGGAAARPVTTTAAGACLADHLRARYPQRADARLAHGVLRNYRGLATMRGETGTTDPVVAWVDEVLAAAAADLAQFEQMETPAP